MTPNNQRLTLKNLKAEINALKKEVIMNNKHISDMEIKLVKAEKEIKKLKESKNSQNNESNFKCASCSNFSTISRKALKLHIVEKHANKICCEMCDESFKRNSDLEEHIFDCHDSMKKFNCDKCDKVFALEWRLQKHQKIHTDHRLPKCHYFNNMKICPFESIGCMFDHSLSDLCKYGKNCNKKLCSFQHKEIFECKECKFIGNTETELGKHIDEIHEKWELRDKFCDRFCRGDHGMHICFSNEDFQEYVGFNIWETFETDESDSVYKCLKCNFESDDKAAMREHLDAKHEHEKTSKCNICGYEDKTWLGLMNHFRSNH